MKTSRSSSNQHDPITNLLRTVQTLVKPMSEVCGSIKAGSFPWLPVLVVASTLQLLHLLKIDSRIAIQHSTLTKTFFENRMCIVLFAIIPFYVWGLLQVLSKQRLSRRLTEIFQASGLKNNLGYLPNFIFDKPIDDTTRKLRVSRAILPIESFEKAKSALEGGLQIFIDEFRENRTTGTVDITYAHQPMVENFPFPSVTDLRPSSFYVGSTRAKTTTANLNQVPHLLVAGQTGGGKSTFLRQFITSIFLREKGCSLTLIDLKGGLEFQIFENLPRVTVTPDIRVAILEIAKLSEVIERRMALLRANKCKDLIEYSRGEKSQSPIYRHIVVVDEAAEMFLAGHHASAKDVQLARRVLSQIARQGRSIGIHLVVATQRPDSRALDPQIKANLTGVLCFQMVNDISSITVLGTGRATDLPPVPGRGIWKCGAETIEVQTPFLNANEAEELLRDHYQSVPAKIPVPVSNKTKTTGKRPVQLE